MGQGDVDQPSAAAAIMAVSLSMLDRDALSRVAEYAPLPFAFKLANTACAAASPEPTFTHRVMIVQSVSLFEWAVDNGCRVRVKLANSRFCENAIDRNHIADKIGMWRYIKVSD